MVATADPNTYCQTWCGVQHSVSFGNNGYVRPWHTGLGGPNAALVLKVNFTPGNFYYTSPNTVAWDYMCALLLDTQSGYRLEYCVSLWKSFAQTDDANFHYEPDLSTYFTQALSELPSTSTNPLVTNQGQTTQVGSGAIGHTGSYQVTITKANLANAINAVDAKCGCLWSDPNNYQMLGLEVGEEIAAPTGSPAGLASKHTGLTAYSVW